MPQHQPQLHNWSRKTSFRQAKRQRGKRNYSFTCRTQYAFSVKSLFRFFPQVYVYAMIGFFQKKPRIVLYRKDSKVSIPSLKFFRNPWLPSTFTFLSSINTSWTYTFTYFSSVKYVDGLTFTFLGAKLTGFCLYYTFRGIFRPKNTVFSR